ncbi:hypothetical protein QFC24_006298 [Naganishia onofrii]|uniref:Uncharacterized protein n=1 Tax=Naganishia onofrii TaxID=1851511 RepID=A0ACC2X301_9TREE|nr:hypothetical protein QFC24_006298 [Naganishia onofrii]
MSTLDTSSAAPPPVAAPAETREWLDKMVVYQDGLVTADRGHLDAAKPKSLLSVNAESANKWHEELLSLDFATLDHVSLRSALEDTISVVLEEKERANRLKAQQERDKANPIRKPWEMPPDSWSGPWTSDNFTTLVSRTDNQSIGPANTADSQLAASSEPTLNTLPGSHHTD